MQNTRTRDAQVILASGEPGFTEIPVPYQGRVNRLLVKQLSGPLEGFTATLFDRLDAVAGQAVNSANPDDQFEHANSDAHRVLGPTVVDAGDSEMLMEQLWVFYENRDELPSNGIRNNLLYVEITPAGDGDKRFMVVITTVRDN